MILCEKEIPFLKEQLPEQAGVHLIKLIGHLTTHLDRTDNRYFNNYIPHFEKYNFF
jgi:hypothetical protein